MTEVDNGAHPEAVPRWVAGTAVAGTIAIALGAFWLSFTALADLARRSGIGPGQAWAWPLIVDGIIVVATISVVALHEYGRTATRYPWSLLLAGAGVSVTANAVDAVVSADASVPLAVAASVSAVPPLVLLAITHLTVELTRRTRRPRPSWAMQRSALPDVRGTALRLRAAGMSNRQIAAEVGVHPSTGGPLARSARQRGPRGRRRRCGRTGAPTWREGSASMSTRGNEQMTLDTADVERFVTTSEGLRTVLTVIDRLGLAGWQLPAVEVLMKVAARRYTPVARAWRRSPEDAAHAAWLAMRGRSARTADDPWGVVTRAVELSMQAEAYGDRLLISPDKARRPQHRPPDAPVRAGEHQEFLYDVIAADVEDGLGERIDQLVATIAALLVVVGWSHHEARWAVEYVVSRTADLGSQESARDVLRRDGAIRLRLGLPQRAWTKLVGLLVGPQSGHGGTVQPGLLERVLLGETLTELLGDAALVRRAHLIRAGDHG